MLCPEGRGSKDGALRVAHSDWDTHGLEQGDADGESNGGPGPTRAARVAVRDNDRPHGRGRTPCMDHRTTRYAGRICVLLLARN
jgi:hypothetical protein